MRGGCSTTIVFISVLNCSQAEIATRPCRDLSPRGGSASMYSVFSSTSTLRKNSAYPGGGVVVLVESPKTGRRSTDIAGLFTRELRGRVIRGPPIAVRSMFAPVRLPGCASWRSVGRRPAVKALD
ncbi:hypothetical protein B0H11DRAFT_1372858 [Mycena galericulata]|nr:hypothetical protein B0H11DRAFT_1372858 [Mycena galericulata]